MMAFKKVSGEYDDLQLVLAGPKEHQYRELTGLSSELGLRDRVVFPGVISEDDDPAALYSGAEIFLMPSLYEGFGLPPLEAMACGTAVIASSTTAVPEVVRDAGILVNPRNIDEISDAIRLVLTNAQLKKRMIEKGLKISLEYEQSGVNRKLADFFRSAYRESLR